MDDELQSQQEPSRFDKKYRLLVINDESYEEVGSYRLTELNVYLFASSVLVALVLLLLLLFVLTPLKNIIPGYAETNALNNKKEIVKVYKHIDSLENVVGAQAVYLASVGKALRGETGASSLDAPEGLADFAKANEHLIAQAKSALQAPVATNTSTSAANTPVNTALETEKSSLTLIAPVVKGMVTDAFNVQPGHFGIDIAAPKNTPIQSVADGVVISASWTLETGYVIAVQHKDNLVSFYKHNSVLYKKVGTTVKAGEAIAVIGNTGHLSSGPHLHFELWQGGKPLNPSEQIEF
jgi:murein DD-endopeptidase MepM/ murein hydrolase activator NlpD